MFQGQSNLEIPDFLFDPSLNVINFTVFLRLPLDFAQAKAANVFQQPILSLQLLKEGHTK